MSILIVACHICFGLGALLGAFGGLATIELMQGLLPSATDLRHMEAVLLVLASVSTMLTSSLIVRDLTSNHHQVD
ncbi:hypothetical protein [Vibrio mediterranei]|uniref:hypothetical protein n=1 Tax=Vibrio mediterranei TaxID=689 RepID=UPI00406775A5